MEGSCKVSSPRKRVFNFFPCLLTLIFTTNLSATNEIPLPMTALANSLTYKAVPIFANTLATFNNLKSINTVTAENVALLPAIETSAALMIAESEANAVKKEEVISFAMTKVLASSVSKLERRKDIANFAESHIDWGYKYRYGGTTLEKGIDCSGFTRYVLDYFDIKASRTSEEQYETGTKVPVDAAKPGDLVFFGHKGRINHVAMVVSNDAKGLVVVHSTNRGIVKDNITESKNWKPMLLNQAVSTIGN
jgi:NlpC/P60 family